MQSEKRELMAGTAWYGTAWRRPVEMPRAEDVKPPRRTRGATSR
jgi:hypothetical protein